MATVPAAEDAIRRELGARWTRRFWAQREAEAIAALIDDYEAGFGPDEPIPEILDVWG